MPALSGRWRNSVRARLYDVDEAVSNPVRLVGSAEQTPAERPADLEQLEPRYTRALRLLDAALTLSEELRRENVLLRLTHDRLREELVAVHVGVEALRAQPPPAPAAIDTTLVQEQAELIGALREALRQAQARLDATPPTRLVNLPPEGVPLQAITEDAIRQALERTGGVQTQAAALLRVSSRVLSYRVCHTAAGRDARAASPRCRRPRALS